MFQGEYGGSRSLRAAAATAAFLFCGAVLAHGRVLTAQEYARAERFMPYDTAPLVDHAVAQVHWLDDRHFCTPSKVSCRSLPVASSAAVTPLAAMRSLPRLGFESRGNRLPEIGRAHV